jgi:hypothetical protein
LLGTAGKPQRSSGPARGESQFPLEEGRAIFVPAGAEDRFTDYEAVSVLVIFDRSR